MTSTVPYIGAMMNLLSKSDIRYTGILASVDVEKCSIGLARGKFIVVRLMSNSSGRPWIWIWIRFPLQCGATGRRVGRLRAKCLVRTSYTTT
jgi:hypothetical protein